MTVWAINIRAVILTTLFLMCLGCSSVANEPIGPEQRLQVIIDDHWQLSLDENPILASNHGYAEYRDRLPGVSQVDRMRRLDRYNALLARLAAVRVEGLSEASRVNHALLTWLLELDVEHIELYLDRLPFNTFYSFWDTALSASHGLNMRSESDYLAYIQRIKDSARYINENIENMRAGIKDGFVLPKIVVAGVAPTVRARSQISAAESRLYAPFKSMPASISATQQQYLSSAALEAIENYAIAALVKVANFLETEYTQAASDSLAVNQLPNGNAYYRHAIKRYVTEEIDPQEIHAIGLAEVKRLREEMESQMQAAGFHGTLDEFADFLRTDAQFYATTKTELLKEAAYIAKRIDYKLPEFFGKLPRQPYGIVPVPDAIAPNYTTASYNPAPLEGIRGGAYWVNTYRLDQRPLYEMVALTLHEAVPGHHLQSAISLELENVPSFRRDLYLSAYGEGWGLYSEALGVEMGVYDTPYQHFGRLSYEMWRACRLVIDTGIHAQGWSRQQALDFLADNTSLSLANVRAEVDRYISWPGQALSYKMGQLKISELRALTQAELGGQFDIREFHDTLLGQGAMPLALLEQQIQAYIKRKKAQNHTENN